jgi:hypothetical protein
VKEVKAEQMKIDYNLGTRQEAMEVLGNESDFESVCEKIKLEKDTEKKMLGDLNSDEVISDKKQENN